MVSLTKEVCGGWEKDFLLAVIVPDTNAWYMTFMGGSWETFHYLPVAFWSWLYSVVWRGETEWAAHFSYLTPGLHLWFLMLRQRRGVLNSGSWSIKQYRKKKQTDSIIFQALVSPLAFLVLSSGIFHHASLHFENSFKKLLNREKTWALLSLALGGYLLTTNTESFQAVFPRSARATTSALSFLERFPYLC